MKSYRLVLAGLLAQVVQVHCYNIIFALRSSCGLILRKFACKARPWIECKTASSMVLYQNTTELLMIYATARNMLLYYIG